MSFLKTAHSHRRNSVCDGQSDGFCGCGSGSGSIGPPGAVPGSGAGPGAQVGQPGSWVGTGPQSAAGSQGMGTGVSLSANAIVLNATERAPPTTAANNRDRIAIPSPTQKTQQWNNTARRYAQDGRAGDGRAGAPVRTAGGGGEGTPPRRIRLLSARGRGKRTGSRAGGFSRRRLRSSRRIGCPACPRAAARASAPPPCSARSGRAPSALRRIHRVP